MLRHELANEHHGVVETRIGCNLADGVHEVENGRRLGDERFVRDLAADGVRLGRVGTGAIAHHHRQTRKQVHHRFALVFRPRPEERLDVPKEWGDERLTRVDVAVE